MYDHSWRKTHGKVDEMHEIRYIMFPFAEAVTHSVRYTLSHNRHADCWVIAHRSIQPDIRLKSGS